MRLANVNERAVLVAGPGVGIDVAQASEDRFGPRLGAIYDRWEEFVAWVPHAARRTPDVSFVPADLGAPSPTPSQVFAIGLNYAEHATETNISAPTTFPPVFTKFVSSITGPETTVELPSAGSTDWEVELVVVIGRSGRDVEAADAWSHVAGVTVGQDLSERVGQMEGPVPQFSLAKSHRGFAPTGPFLVTVDELEDRDALALTATVDDELVQQGNTRHLLFGVPALLEGLSAVVDLRPGDLIFTGTPPGVGMGRRPQRYLRAGEVLVSSIEGIGNLRQQMVASPRMASTTIRPTTVRLKGRST